MRVAVIVSVLALVAMAQGQSAWVGEWTDSRYGGSVFFCENDNGFYSGLYTNAGFYWGEVVSSGNTMRGTWTEGGFQLCLEGTFEFTLDDNDSFSGFYECTLDDDDDVAPDDDDGRTFVRGLRLSSNTPADIQCARLFLDDDDAVFVGEFFDGTVSLDVCRREDEVEDFSFYAASYEFPGSSGGYETGAAAELAGISSRKVFYGFYQEQDGFSGSSLWWNSGRDQMTNVFWEGAEPFAGRESGYLGASTYTLVDRTSVDECNSNFDMVQSTWIGEWSDSEYGGQLAICMNNREIFGLYSEFGVIHGNIVDDDGSEVQGLWYEPGEVGDSCLTGFFDISLSGDASSFQGFYTCADDIDQTQFSWREDRLSIDIPSDSQCARLSPAQFDSTTLNGEYQGGSLRYDICTQSTTYVASFENSRGNGWEEGYAAESGKLIAGAFYQGDGVAGTSLWYLDWENRPSNLWWAGVLDDDLDYDDADDSGSHGYDAYEFVAGTTSTECNRNVDIYSSFDTTNAFSTESFGDDDDTSGRDDSSDSSDAGTTAVAFAAALLAFVAAAF